MYNTQFSFCLKNHINHQLTKTEAKSNSQNTYNTNSYQSQGGPRYGNIRMMINNGEIDSAEALLNSIKLDERNAEWYFLKGCIFTRRGYIFDAIKFIDKACSMDPGNQEYKMMRDNLRSQSNNYSNQTQQNSAGCSMCDVCSTLICLDCLCNHGC